MATDSTARIPRAILEDRYDGLITDETDRLTKLGTDVYLSITKLVDRTARSLHDDETSAHGGAIQVAIDTLRETIVREIHERGIAR